MLDTATVERLKKHIAKLQPSFAGRLLFYCLPFRKRVTLSNLKLVFGDSLTPEEINKLALCFYSHLASSLREIIALRFMSNDHLRQKARVVGAEFPIEIAKKNKGVLILTGHFGNWEVAPMAGILNFQEFQGRFYFVRKALSFKWLEKILFRRFYTMGLNVIPKKNSLPLVEKALAKNGAVVFIMDQHSSVPREGLAVEFFGKPAGTFKSLAMLARVEQSPVVPVMTYRDPNGQHVLQFFAPLNYIEDPDPKRELYLNTRQYNATLEKMVLAHPEQWLWLHRRWKI